MKRWTGITGGMLAATIGLVLLGFTCAGAAPPEGKGGGNGGGGGDGGDGGGYTIVHLNAGDLDVTTASADDLNEYDPLTDHQDVVGYVKDTEGSFYPMFWRVAGQTVLPIPLLGSGALPHGVNDNDEIVGDGGTSSEGPFWALFWPDPFSQPVVLPPLPGHEEAVANRINNQGVIVGISRNITVGQDETGAEILLRGRSHPVAWQVDYLDNQLVISGPIDLGALSPDEPAYASYVANATSDTVSVTRISGRTAHNGATRSVLWEITSVTDEQGIPQIQKVSGPTDLGALPGDNGNTPRGINNHGDVCGAPGSLTLFGLPMIAIEDLKTTDGDLSYPLDINDLTEMVGDYYYGVGEQATVLWQSDGTPVDLNRFTGGTEWAYLDDARAINNRGAIAGWGSRYISGKKNSPRVRGVFLMIPN